MQALHHKLDVVLVQILRYNSSETDYSFCEDSPPAGLHPVPGCLQLPHHFFRCAAPVSLACSLAGLLEPLRHVGSAQYLRRVCCTAG